MLQFLKSIRKTRPHGAQSVQVSDIAPAMVLLADGEPLEFAAQLQFSSGFPFADWRLVRKWVQSVPDDQQSGAWLACQRAWLLHLRDALGGRYQLSEDPHSLLISSLEPNIAKATLTYMSRTLHRVVRVLDGIAQLPKWGKSILIIFDDAQSYYQYVAHFYPEEGEFATSAGMHINAGCGHFLTIKSSIWAIEPTIAHEMTHSCVSTLPLPTWLNEGLAVNTELRLTHQGTSKMSPQAMHRKHRAYWSPQTIQDFWSGRVFKVAGAGQELAYDLARIIVEQMAMDWPSFTAFVTAAHRSDAGAAAAEQYLGVDLGRYVAVLLESADELGWSPLPKTWFPKAQAQANVSS